MPPNKPLRRAKLQEAVAHHQAGRLETAERLYRQVLETEPKNPDALHLLGLTAHQSGRQAAAEAHIREAIAINPAQAAYWSNLGNVLGRQGRPEEAVAAFHHALDLDPGLATAAFNLGNTLESQGSLNEAVAAYERALAVKPAYAEASCNLGIVLRRQGNVDGAIAAQRRALEVNPHLAEVWNNLGLAMHDGGMLDEAVAAYEEALHIEQDYAQAWSNLGVALRDGGRLDDSVIALQRAAELRPDDAEALCNLGVAFRQRGELNAAVSAYRRALAIAPDFVEALNNLGVALRAQDRLDEAAAVYRRALDLNPRLIEARNNLGEIFEKMNRLDEADRVLDAADQDDRGHPSLKRLAATLHRRRGRIKEALAELADLPEVVSDGRTLQRVHTELGQLYDRDGRPDEAMHHFRSAKRVQSESYEASRVDASAALDGVRALRRRFTEDWVRTWTPLAHASDDAAPVFLVGFPRSGTTLLDQILDSHPRLQVLEERPCMTGVAGFLSKAPGGYPGALAMLDTRARDKAVHVYFDGVDRHLERLPGTTLVDKFPLNIMHVGLIHRLFPQARILFALRHPCDVCLSSFMQLVELNDAMANFLTLEATATFYDEVMCLWRNYTRLFSFRVHTVRYESVVADFEAEVRRVLDFLELEWDDAVLDYAGHARRRGRIATPSYHQVTEPIYERSKFRWERYRRHLEPVRERLAPHVEYFGY